MVQPTAATRERGRPWGVIATILAVVAVGMLGLFWLLSLTVDENLAWAWSPSSRSR